MLKAYINLLKNEPCNVNYLFTPLNYDFENNELRAVNNDSIVINSREMLSLFKHYPDKVIDSIKIRLEDDKYIVYSMHNPESSSEWYGVTMIITDESHLPLKPELEVINEVYEVIGNFITKKMDYESLSAELISKKAIVKLNEATNEVKQFLKESRDKIKELLNDDYSRNVTGSQFKPLHKERDKYYLEDFIIRNESSQSEWNFYLISNQAPITNVLRYDNGSFIKLDKSPDYDPELRIYNNHLFNCTTLSWCYNISKFLGSQLGLGETSLRHLTNRLSDNEGYEFTFIDEMNHEDNELIIILEVKNRLKTGEPYIKKLFGNEREALNAIKNSLMNNDYLSELLDIANKPSTPLDKINAEDKIFKTIKEVITGLTRQKRS